ncbi:MAG: biotin--[acetyl-CoA-carboxylase] ligase [Dehalococcoidales bacterium]|nr:biotin--[acetyl-CoA-carboxylase] ligase [Dehalococcoidales bacterium]
MNTIKDKLTAELISSGVDTRIIGQKVMYYPTASSTNEIAIQESHQGASEGTVVIAGEQTRGRGRLSRSWLTPEGNIALSVLLYPHKSILHSLIMMASLGVCYAIEGVTGLVTQIKWPNDVLINGRKVCGILIESDVRKDKVKYSVIGIGLNVNVDKNELVGIPTPATSLQNEAGRDISRLRLVQELIAGLDNLYLSLSAGGSVFEDWRDRLVTLGTEVRVTSGNEVIEGLAESVDSEGNLLVRTPDGKLNRIVAGDVTLRR